MARFCVVLAKKVLFVGQTRVGDDKFPLGQIAVLQVNSSVLSRFRHRIILGPCTGPGSRKLLDQPTAEKNPVPMHGGGYVLHL